MFEPTRLTAARKRRGWSLTRLAHEAQLSRRSVSLFENGQRPPADETTELLAHTLGVDVSFFSGEPVDEIREAAVSFRALSKMPAGVRDRALGAGSIAFLIDEWIEQRFELPVTDLPTLENRDPELAAMEVRARWGLAERPISNMLHLLEAHGVRVYSLTGSNVTLDGYSLRWRGRPYVFLSTLKTGERGRFDAAHELGHLVLHHGDRETSGPEAEKDADRFASAFLMPAGSILAQGLRNATVPKVLVVKKHWNVSAMALALRANQMGLMSEWAYRSLVIGLSQRGYRSSEPGGMPGRESSKLHGKVLSELRARGEGLHTVARDLGLPTAEISEHVFGLVPMVLSGGGGPTDRSAPSTPTLRLHSAP